MRCGLNIVTAYRDKDTRDMCGLGRFVPASTGLMLMDLSKFVSQELI